MTTGSDKTQHVDPAGHPCLHVRNTAKALKDRDNLSVLTSGRTRKLATGQHQWFSELAVPRALTPAVDKQGDAHGSASNLYQRHR